MTKQHRIRGHPINRTPPNARNPAVKPAYNFVPLDDDKKLHPLVRRLQDRRIAPGQPAKVLPTHAEILRSLNDVAEMLAQSAGRGLVAQMRKRCGPPRKHRHQRLTRLGQLGLQSGPGPPRRLKIRLITRIDNGFSFPQRSHLSRTKLAFAQPRLKPRSPLHRSPQSRRLEPQRLLALQHGAQLRDPMRRTLPDAHRPGAPPRAATNTTATAGDRPLEQPQHPHLPAAARGDKRRPAAAAVKSPRRHADCLLDVAEFDHELGRFGCDDAARSLLGRARSSDDGGRQRRLLHVSDAYDWHEDGRCRSVVVVPHHERFSQGKRQMEDRARAQLGAFLHGR